MADFSAICTLWSGNFDARGVNRAGYTPIYVSRLKDMLAKHTKKSVDFVCFSNWPKREFRDDIRVIPLQTNWPAWWSKIEMFRPGLDLENRVLALDIDMLIVGGMDDIIDFHTDFAITSYWSYSSFRTEEQAIASLRKKRDCQLVPLYSSDVIIMDRDARKQLFTEFRPDHMITYCGDQDWMGDCLGPNELRFPRPWARKMSIRDQGSRRLHIGQAKVIGCHPIKNHQLATNGYTYADKIWKGEVSC